MSEVSYRYNDNIDALEVDPLHLAEGVAYARQHGHHALRILDLNRRGGATTDLDFSPLAGSEAIRSLSISDSFNPGKVALDAPYELPALESLSFQDRKIRPDLSRLPQLETLHAAWSKELSGFASLKRLRHLLLTSLGTSDCAFMEGLSALRELRLSGGTVEALAGIEGAPRLESIKIDHCSKLSDVSAVTRLEELRSLHIEKCKRLRDFSFLERSASVERLFVSELDSIAFVPGMRRLRSLKFWNVEDGDISPVLKSSSLEQVDFFPDRRHYSHTKADIEALLAAKTA